MKEKILEALNLVKTGNWNDAHQIAQSQEGEPDYDRLHAFLHRMEGDQWNAAYWYQRCNTKVPKISLEEELKYLLDYFSGK